METVDALPHQGSDSIMIAGYPVDKGLKTMWLGKGFAFMQPGGTWVLHDVDTMPGNSGSGCFARDKEGHLALYHVHNGYLQAQGLNYATSLTPERMSLICRWIRSTMQDTDGTPSFVC